MRFPPTCLSLPPFLVTSSKPPLGPRGQPLPVLQVTSSEASEALSVSMSAVELRAPGQLPRPRDSAVSTDSGLGGEFPSHTDRDSSASLPALSLQVRLTKMWVEGGRKRGWGKGKGVEEDSMYGLLGALFLTGEQSATSQCGC